MKVNHKLLSYVFGGFLLVSIGFIFFITNEKDNVIKEREIQYIEIEKSKSDLEVEHQSTITSLNEAELKIDNLSNLNESANKEIGGLKKKIKSILYKEKVTKKELSQAKVLIVELNSKVDSYLKENHQLKKDNQKLNDDNNGLQMEKNQLVKVLDSTRDQKRLADEKIDLGSTLSISNISVIGINPKGKETLVSDKISKLRFSFVINENRISSSGVKTVYFVLTNPIGKEVVIEGKSDILSTRNDGEKLYIAKSNLDYTTGLIKTAKFDVSMDKVLMDGLYKVQIYENGLKIGETKLGLKKRKILGLF